MRQHDIEESVGYWSMLATQAFQRSMNEELSPHGVTFRQGQVLAWLKIEGEMSQTELAARLMIEPPTLVGILDRMERDGWIERLGCTGDRRKKMIRTLPAAESIWEKMMEIGLRVRATATSGMTLEEAATLKRLLRKMHGNLAGAPAIDLEAVPGQPIVDVETNGCATACESAETQNLVPERAIG